MLPGFTTSDTRAKPFIMLSTTALHCTREGQCNAVQCSAVHDHSVLCSLVPFSAVLSSAIRYTMVQCSSEQGNTAKVQFVAMKFSVWQCMAVHCSAV